MSSPRKPTVTVMRGRSYTLSPSSKTTSKRSRVNYATSKRAKLSFEGSVHSSRDTKRRREKTKQRTKREAVSNTKSTHSDLSQYVTFPATVVSKWQPLSQETVSWCECTLLASMGQCVSGLNVKHKSQAERYLQQVITEVKRELLSLKAPGGNEVKSITGAKQKVRELKESCVMLVERNKELEERLEDQKRIVSDMVSNTERLQDTDGSHEPVKKTVQDEVEFEDEDSFREYLSQLFVTSREIECDTPYKCL